jgi:hypothetical protein
MKFFDTFDDAASYIELVQIKQQKRFLESE